MVTDRFSASTLAYQGYGRGLDLGELSRLVDWATAGLDPRPDRAGGRAVAVGAARRRGSVDDRMEREGGGFRQRVADGYRALAATGDTPWLVVDGTGTVEAVAAAVWDRASGRAARRRRP